MKNFSNYTDYDKKDNLHFESGSLTVEYQEKYLQVL